MQRLRDALNRSRANRPFVIMMVGLGGLLILGVLAIVLILVLGDNGGDTGDVIAEASATPPSSLPATDTPAPSPTPAPSDTPRPTATRVLGQETPEATPGEGTPTGEAATPTPADTPATSEPTTAAATATQVPAGQTPETGLGWGWIVAIGLGLAGVVLVARRLRLAS
jgi:hypothetical protein